MTANPAKMRRPRPYSLTRRLIVMVLLVEFASALCVSGTAWVYERQMHFRIFDIVLRGRADSVLGAVQDAGDEQDNVMLDKAQLDSPGEDVYEVREADGRLLGRSANWAGPGDAAFAPAQDGYIWLKPNGRHYRALRLHRVRVVDPDEKGGGKPRPVVVVYGAPTHRVWHAIWEAVQFYAGASLAALLVTGLAMAWLLNRGLAPLRLLASEASGVSVRSWEFHPPESAQRMKELAPLSTALETVLQGLERSFLQQRHFVGDAAHELKTAVAVVKSSLQLLAMKPRTPAEYQAGLERCEADCGRMEEVVVKMLALARFDSLGGAQPSLQADLAACLRQVADQFESMARLRRMTITVSAPDSLPVRMATQDCLLLLSNLVLNAIQHSPAGSTATLTAASHNDAELGPSNPRLSNPRSFGSGLATLRIEDQGEGIDPADLPHVFERFYRGDASRDRKTGGTGLGLAICKAIVEQAGGSIVIESTVGVGTSVAIALPVPLPLANPVPAPEPTPRSATT